VRRKYHWNEEDLVITNVSKHAGGGHDQKTHGRRGKQALIVDASKPHKGGFKGSPRIQSKVLLIPSIGSFYDDIDFDDPDYHPVQQLLDLAADYLPFTDDAEISLDVDFKNVDIELFAESLDAMLVASEMFPEVKLAGLSYEGGAGVGGSASPSTGILTINAKSIMKGEKADSFITQYQWGHRDGYFVPVDVSPAQATVMHEFGHIVRYSMMKSAPTQLIKVENETLKAIDPSLKGEGYKFLTKPEHDSQYAPPSGPKTPAQMLSGDSIGYWYRQAMPFGAGNGPSSYLQDDRFGTMSGSFSGVPQLQQWKATTSARKGIVSREVSTYAATNGHELFAELFTEAYTRDYADLRPAARAFYDAVEKHWGAAGKKVATGKISEE